MLRTSDQKASRQDGFLARLRTEGKPFLRLCWDVFWKATVTVTAVVFLLFVTLKIDVDDFRDFRVLTARSIFGLVVVFGQVIFYSALAGFAAMVFAAAWRLWGAWILLPLLGALLGAIGFVGLGIVLLRWFDLAPAGAGVHGGGQIAAMILLAVAALVAIIGAAAGGIGGALLVAMGILTLRQAGEELRDGADRPETPHEPDDHRE